jgi:homoserine kinase
MNRKVTVSVPATSANLGPGFDVLGAALKLFNTLEVEAFDSGKKTGGPFVSIEVEGEGVTELPRDKTNVVWSAMAGVFEKFASKDFKKKLGSLVFEIKLINNIPICSGLGSSAAARLGGIIAAYKLLKRKINFQEVLGLAIKLENHPDNIVPALAGGLCVSALAGGEVKFIKFAPPALKAVVCTPEFFIDTTKARAILPKIHKLQDTVFNCQRVGLLVSALLSKRFDLIKFAIEDRIHQPYREKLIKGMSRIFDAAYAAGAYGVALSGSGPSILALTDRARAKKVASAMKNTWARLGTQSRAYILDFSGSGCK